MGEIFKSHAIPNKEFSTKEMLFDELRKNKEIIIDAKKSVILKSCDKGQSVLLKNLDLQKFAETEKAINFDSDYYYFAVNSTLILDSHEDLHDNGVWNQSVKQIQGKNYLICDHDLDIDKVVAKKEHIEILIIKVPFSVIGKDYKGETELLVYKVRKDRIIHKTVKEWLESGDSLECSVRMQYVTILLAMDSENPQDATEKKNYNDYINKIANKNDFEYISHFFIVKEAKNVKESSLVLFGSNHVTGVISDTANKDIEAASSTSKQEPLENTQKRRRTI